MSLLLGCRFSPLFSSVSAHTTYTHNAPAVWKFNRIDSVIFLLCQKHRPNRLVVALFDSISLYFIRIYLHTCCAWIIWFVLRNSYEKTKKKRKKLARQTRKLEIITKTPSKHCQITCNFSSFFCCFVVFPFGSFNYACIECDATTQCCFSTKTNALP